MKKLSIQTIVLAALFGALCYVSSYLKIPIGPVPFSAQTATVILASLLLPPAAAFAAQFIHFLLLFLLGGGTALFISPSFGFVIGFMVAAPVISFIGNRINNIFGWVLAALVGEVIFYVIGIPYMTFVLLSIKMQELSLQQILGFGLYPFILPDLGKLVIAVFLADRIKVLTKKHFSFKEISFGEAKSSITDESIIQQIKYLKNKIEKNEFDFEDYLRLSSLTLTTIMEKFIEDFVMNFWTKVIAPQNAYKELVNIESNFSDFCNVEGLPSLEQLCSQGYNNRNIPEEYKIFDLFSCFEDGKNIEEQIRIEKKLEALFKSYEEKGTLFKENKDGLTFTTDTVFINNHLKTIPNNDTTTIRNKGRVLAYFHDQKEWYERHVDVFFMKKGFYFRLDAKMSTSKLTFIPYNKIEFDRIKKGLKYKNEIFYQSSQINLEAFYNLIRNANNQ